MKINKDRKYIDKKYIYKKKRKTKTKTKTMVSVKLISEYVIWRSIIFLHFVQSRVFPVSSAVVIFWCHFNQHVKIFFCWPWTFRFHLSFLMTIRFCNVCSYMKFQKVTSSFITQSTYSWSEIAFHYSASLLNKQIQDFQTNTLY